MGDTRSLSIVGSSASIRDLGIGPQSGGWRLSTSDLAMGIAIITRSSQFLEVNEALAKMVGLEASQLTNGVHPVSKRKDAARNRLQLDFKAVATAGPGQYEISIHRASGDTFPAEVRVMLLKNDDPSQPEALLCSITDRSDLEAEVERLTRGELRAMQALNSFPESIAILNEIGMIISTNQAWDRFAVANGGAHSFVGLGENYLDVCDRASATSKEAVMAGRGIRDVIVGELREFSLEYDCHAPDQKRWFELYVSCFRELGEMRIVVCHEDITERHYANEQLAMQAQLLAEVKAAVVATDLSGKVVYWSPGATDLLTHTPDEALGLTLTELIDGFPELEAIPADDSLESRETRATLKWADGSPFVSLIQQNPYNGPSGEKVGTLTMIKDISAQAEREEQLVTAYDYMLTVSRSIGDGLFTVDTEGRLINMNPSAERMLGWSEAELEGKPIADAIGYELNLSDENGTWATRVDEDVFTARDGRKLPVSHTTSPFETKQGITGAVVTFTDISAQRLEQKRMELEIEDAIWAERIKQAFAEDRFELYAQPIFDVETGDHIQNELLIRMLENDGTIVAPGAFLPPAEREGLMLEIDHWVIRRAAKLASENHPVEFNLSASSLSDPDLADFIIDEMEAVGADPAKVVIELTETAIVENESTAVDILRKLRVNGFHIALDDFGTGYGSFTYLKNLPVDYLKIDIEFVKDLPINESSRKLVKAVIQLAGNFGLATVAEGVEDLKTVELLKELGVNYMQGFALGRPQPFFVDDAGRDVS